MHCKVILFNNPLFWVFPVNLNIDSNNVSVYFILIWLAWNFTMELFFGDWLFCSSSDNVACYAHKFLVWQPLCNTKKHVIQRFSWYGFSVLGLWSSHWFHSCHDTVIFHSVDHICCASYQKNPSCSSYKGKTNHWFICFYCCNQYMVTFHGCH